MHGSEGAVRELAEAAAVLAELHRLSGAVAQQEGQPAYGQAGAPGGPDGGGSLSQSLGAVAAAEAELEQQLVQGAQLLQQLTGDAAGGAAAAAQATAEAAGYGRVGPQAVDGGLGGGGGVPLPSPLAPGSLEALRTSAGGLARSNAEALQVSCIDVRDPFEP